MIPTEEQIKKLWGRIADKVEAFNEGRHYHFWFNGEVYRGEQTSFSSGIPIIDLNNLFKWAVPKLEYISLSWQPYISKHSGRITIRTLAGIPNKDVVGGMEVTEGIGKDPALALFWAIWKVIDGNNTPAEH